MEQNINKHLVVLKHNQDVNLVIDNTQKKQEYYFIDLTPGDSKVNLNVDLKKDTNSLVHILIFNFNDSKKEVKTFLKYNQNNANCFNNVKVIGFNDSKTNIQLNAMIAKKSINNAAYQNISANLFDNAKVTGEPNLIIDSNNVKAGHAFNVGKISDEIMFYLQSRGLNKHQAIKIIIDSYFNEVFENFDEKIKEEYSSLINNIFDRLADVKN